MNMTTAAPSISVVVIGRNEGQRLARCLESVRRTPGLKNTELIYVDSNSKDGSPELAASYGAQVIVLNAQRTTAALGRNAGWRAAKGEFILFLDGDTILHPDFANAALAPMLAGPLQSSPSGAIAARSTLKHPSTTASSISTGSTRPASPSSAEEMSSCAAAPSRRPAATTPS